MITMKDIIRDGHPTLREVAQEVVMPASDEDKKTLNSLLEYTKMSQDPEMAEKYALRPGIGLAAPQINISKRMFAIHIEDDNSQHSYTLFNPKIVSHSIEKTYLTSGEGCLSVDENIPGYVPRYARITVKAVDHDGNNVKLRIRGLAAIAVQHELDHLNGIMFYDYINQKNPYHEPENAKGIER